MFNSSASPSQNLILAKFTRNMYFGPNDMLEECFLKKTPTDFNFSQINGSNNLLHSLESPS